MRSMLTTSQLSCSRRSGAFIHVFATDPCLIEPLDKPLAWHGLNVAQVRVQRAAGGGEERDPGLAGHGGEEGAGRTPHPPGARLLLAEEAIPQVPPGPHQGVGKCCHIAIGWRGTKCFARHNFCEVNAKIQVFLLVRFSFLVGGKST